MWKNGNGHIVFAFTGAFNDIYSDYKYTYISSGVILVVASLFLFVGMGINYRLQDKEEKEEAKKAQLKGTEDESTQERAGKKTGNEETETPKTADSSTAGVY